MRYFLCDTKRKCNRFDLKEWTIKARPLAKKNGQSDQKRNITVHRKRAEIAEKENFNYPLRALRSLR
jgi:hypothetical protein